MVENKEQELAFNFLQNTNKNIFLTGKAGTGKTTFLKSLSTRLAKRFVVLAPTGVAALQAGGVTLHSFFQLPFHIYIPGTQPKTKKFTQQKINIIRSLDLIIIDEISMVRCDILDEIDYILRRFRRNGKDKPFGGVQVLMIGDLNQLPPIASNTEENELSNYYNNLYFFSSHVLMQSHYITIHLQHIYRQKEPEFVQILNEVRENKIRPNTIARLNACYKPSVLCNIPKDYIVLCTHNKQADSINEDKLNELKTKEKVYTAKIEGDFPENIFPNAENLRLKVGCQIMFLKNDYDFNPNTGKRRYYNGKIGIIKELGEDNIVVQCPDEEDLISVVPYTWENVEYIVDKKTKDITQKIKGEFSQYPIKLAWAITIHKSQGLTFDKAIIHSNHAFSHGQVYVALSRCRSLRGMILAEMFSSISIILDNKVQLFNDNSLENIPDENILQEAESEFLLDNLASIFEFTELSIRIRKLKKFAGEIIFRTYPKISAKIVENCQQYLADIESVDLKYRNYIKNIKFSSATSKEKTDKLLSRSMKAKDYFLEKLNNVNDIIAYLVEIELDDKEDSEFLSELIIEIAVEKELKHRLLTYFKENNFNLGEFLNYKNKLIVLGNNIELKSVLERNPISIKANSVRDNKIKVSKDKEVTTDIQNQELFDLLRNWRNKLAKKQNVPAYTIVSQKGLIGIANLKPQTEKELLKVYGIGPKTVELYGKAILKITKAN